MERERDKMGTAKYLRGLRRAIVALLFGTVCLPSFAVIPAKADPSETAREVVNGVIQSVIQSIRDEIRMRLAHPVGAPLRFNGEPDDPAAASIYNDAFRALGYMPPKASPPAPTPAPSWLFGATGTGSYDYNHSSAGGINTHTNSFTVTGGLDATRIGVFGASDALTFVATGSDSFARADIANAAGVTSTTPGIAGTVSYLNGGFSTDFTVNGQWTHSLGMTTTAVSYTPNAQYRFDLPNAWWWEPTIGDTYTQTSLPGGLGNTHTNEVHGGVRVGTETPWYGVRVQSQVEGDVFNITDQSVPTVPGGAALPAGTPGSTPSQQGKTGGRGSVRFTFLWTDHFSTYIEGHIHGIDDTLGEGVTGALRYTW
jgi:hypothetical protein